MTEIWKPVTGYNGKYSVSNFGRVRSEWIERAWGSNISVIARIQNLSVTPKGYLTACLSQRVNGKMVSKHYLVHRLVAIEYVDNQLNKPHINHIDSNKQNNHVSNLEWCTNEENRLHDRMYGKYNRYALNLSNYPANQLQRSNKAPNHSNKAYHNTKLLSFP